MKILRVVFIGEEHPHYTITKAFESGFEVDTIYWEEIETRQLNSILIARVKAIKYDAVFMQIQSNGIILPETAKIMSEHTLVLNWTGDVRNDIIWYKQLAAYCITIFTNMTNVVEMQNEGYNAEYLQTGYDHNWYYNMNLERQNGIVFCANYYPSQHFPETNERLEVIRGLYHLPEFKLYGGGWEKFAMPQKAISNREEAETYNKNTLSISVSHFNYSMYFSDRLLREMACGSCVISHRFQDFEETGLVENKNIVFYDNIPNLLEKCHYYLNNKDEAIAIGKNAADFVANNYRWSNFVENLKKIIVKYGK